MKNANVFLYVLAVSFMATACGNLASNTLNAPATVDSSNSTATTPSNSTFSAAQQCAAKANIKGPYYNNSVSAEYIGCNSNGTVQIFPADQTTKSICAFPVNVSSGQVSVFMANANAPYAQRYVYQCGTTSTAGVSFSFSPNANGAYVVDQKDAATLATCIAFGDISTCASNIGLTYSYGQF